jgi:NADPH-dependent 2,4-dienoyl-CoA reductase/sulfur reductase-like enzyme
MHQKKVSLVFPSEGICSRIFPRELSQFLNGYYREKGVEVLPGESVTACEHRGEIFVLKTSGGRQIEADAVVAGVGVKPNVKLAQTAGLRVEDGIVVDKFLQTSHADVYAAGDVAAFYNPALGKQLRVEHEDNANTMGKCAGRNMAGSPQAYEHLPFFYSDLFDLGYEAVGELDSKLETTVDWKAPFKEGVICYRQDGRVRGVLLWNVWGQVDAARQLIAERRSIPAEEIRERFLKAA